MQIDGRTSFGRVRPSISGHCVTWGESNGNRIKESLENINVDGSKMECDCVNAWLQGAEFNNGYNCDDANEVAECAPKVAKDGYNFEFQEDTSQSAIVSEF